MRHITLAVAAGLLFSSSNFAQAPVAEPHEPALDAKQSAPTAPAASVKTFYTQVAQRNLSGIALGEMTRARGSTPAMRTFGQKMVEQYTRSNEQLGLAARRLGIALPTQPDSEQKATAKRLDLIEGAAFDMAYLDELLAAQSSMATLLENQKATPQDPSTSNFIAATLPGIKEQGAEVRRLSHGRRDVGGAATLSPSPMSDTQPRMDAPL